MLTKIIIGAGRWYLVSISRLCFLFGITRIIIIVAGKRERLSGFDFKKHEIHKKSMHYIIHFRTCVFEYNFSFIVHAKCVEFPRWKSLFYSNGDWLWRDKSVDRRSAKMLKQRKRRSWKRSIIHVTQSINVTDTV